MQPASTRITGLSSPGLGKTVKGSLEAVAASRCPPAVTGTGGYQG